MEQDNTVIMMNNRIGEDLLTAEIQEINWERILLHMDVQITRKDYAADRDLQFYMVTGFFKANAIFDAVRGENDLWHLTLNVTNPGYCFCLPTGHAQPSGAESRRERDSLRQCPRHASLCKELHRTLSVRWNPTG